MAIIGISNLYDDAFHGCGNLLDWVDKYRCVDVLVVADLVVYMCNSLVLGLVGTVVLGPQIWS